MSIDKSEVTDVKIRELEKRLNKASNRKDLWPKGAVAMFDLPHGLVTIYQTVQKPGIFCRVVIIYDQRTQEPFQVHVTHLPFNEARLDYFTGIVIDDHYVIWSPERGRAYFSATQPEDMTGVCVRNWVDAKIAGEPRGKRRSLR
mgnify:CR=1 FL=1